MALGGGGGGGGSRAIEAGRAVVRLGVKDDMSGRLKGIGGKFMEFGKKVLGATGIGGLVSGVLGGLNFKETADDLARMDTVAKAFGVSGSRMSGLFGLLAAAGGEFKENLEGVIQFSDTVSQALSKTDGEGAKLFDGLGVTAKDIANLPIDEKFYSVLGAIRQLPQPLQESKLALLGGTDSMKQWQPLLAMSEEEFRGIAKQAALSSAELRQAAESSKAMKQAGAGLERAWQRVVVILAPAVTSLAKAAGDGLAPVADWLSDRDLVEELAIQLLRARGLWLDFEQAATTIGIDIVNGFTAGWDTAILAVKTAIADLISFAGKSTRKALDIPLKVLAAIDPRAAAGASAALTAAEGMADPVAAVLKKNALAEFQNGEEIRRVAKQNMLDKFAFDKQVNALVLKDFEGRRQGRKDAASMAELMNMVVSPGGERLAAASRSLGAIGGGGSFLSQTLGLAGTDSPAKQMVKEQRRGNVLLKDVVKAVQDSVPRFL